MGGETRWVGVVRTIEGNSTRDDGTELRKSQVFPVEHEISQPLLNIGRENQATKIDFKNVTEVHR